eukprot:1148146-Pelagomonas_calceolata.AAC.1
MQTQAAGETHTSTLPPLAQMHTVLTPTQCVQVWVPEADADTSSGGNMHQHKASPYTGAQLKGKVIATIANGNLVSLYSALPQQPCGSAIKRSL